MRLTKGKSARIILTDGTTLEGIVTRSWLWRTIKLTDVVSLQSNGEIRLDGYVLIPARSVFFAQVTP